MILYWSFIKFKIDDKGLPTRVNYTDRHKYFNESYEVYSIAAQVSFLTVGTPLSQTNYEYTNKES